MERKILIVEDDLEDARKIVRFLSGIDATPILSDNDKEKEEKVEFRIELKSFPEGKHLIGTILEVGNKQNLHFEFTEIIIARTKAKAEEIFNKEKDNISLIFLDLSLPMEDIYETRYWHGEKFLKKFLQIPPRERPLIILLSQYLDALTLSEVLDIIIKNNGAGDVSFFHKNILKSTDQDLLLTEMQTLTIVFFLNHYTRTLASYVVKKIEERGSIE